MKKRFLMMVLLLTSFVLVMGMMTIVSLALRYSAQDTVFMFAESEETVLPQEEIQFPYPIPGTTMTVESVVIYDGPLTDENNDAPIANGLALHLHNTGEQALLAAGITLKIGNVTYHFSGSHIPAGAGILLPEVDNALWSDRPCTACTGWAIYAENIGLTETDVEILEIDMDTLSVTNRTINLLCDVQLYYKNFLPEANIFLGSQTHTVWVGNIQPGETVLVSPERYAGAYSKVVRIDGERG